MLWKEVSSLRLELAHGGFKNLMQLTVFNRLIASFSWYHDLEHHPHVPPLCLFSRLRQQLIDVSAPNPPRPPALLLGIWIFDFHPMPR